jgi:hypothetical protein
MKKKLNLMTPLGLAFILILAACRKTDSSENMVPGGLRSAPQDSAYNPPVVLYNPQSIGTPPSTSPPPQQPPPQSSCPSLPIYGDTIIYPHPVNNPGPGKYLSWPVGMVLDSTTGAIDVTASQTGMKYIMGFVKSGTSDTCLAYLTIGGAAYADSVYVLSEGEDYAVPYFEANPNDLTLCQTSNACKFDVTGSAAAQHVVVNKSTGAINLEQTLNGPPGLGGLLGGAFGILPVNGQTITTTIYYKIGDDPSNNALQNISVQLVYYDQPSLINGGLLGTVLNRLDELTSGNVISTTSNPRPPLVVIVRHN